MPGVDKNTCVGNDVPKFVVSKLNSLAQKSNEKILSIAHDTSTNAKDFFTALNLKEDGGIDLNRVSVPKVLKERNGKCVEGE